MKNVYYVLIVCLSVLAGIYGTFMTRERPAIRIALFQPAQHPAMDEINEAFKDEVVRSLEQAVGFVNYNAQGNPTLMRGLADEIGSGDFDLVFTIGRACSEIMHKALQKRSCAMPLIFTAVEDPIQSGLIKKFDRPGLHASGIQEDHNYQAQLEHLLKLKPGVKDIVVVYDSSRAEFIESFRMLSALCASRDISCRAVEILKPNEVYEKVSPVMKSVDVVMIFKDHTACMAIDGLIKLCRQYGATLYASDLNSCQKGAAIAYGVREADYGRLAGMQASLVLHGNLSASDVPVRSIEEFYLQVNKDELQQQELPINAQTLFYMQYGMACVAQRGGV